MKKKLLLTALSLFTIGLLGGCSGGTYSKYVTLGEYKGLAVNMVTTEITDDMVQDEIEFMLEENTVETPVDRAAKEGDSVNIDYIALAGTAEQEDDSAEDFSLIVGNGDSYEEIETALVGAKAGDTLEVPASDEYVIDGEKVTFKVTVNSVSEVSIPELNDEFVQEVYDYDSVEDFKTAVKEEITASHEEDNRYNAGTDAMQLAIENATIKGYPDDLYEKCKEEYNELNQQFADMFGVSVEELGISEDDAKEEIESMINERMVTVAIAEKEKLELSEEEYDTFLENNFELYGFETTAEFVESYTKEGIEEMALLEKVQNFLLENATITSVTDDEYYGSYEDEDSEFIDEDELAIEDDDLEDADLEDTDLEDADEETDTDINDELSQPIDQEVTDTTETEASSEE